jgi:hypothetical protein
LEKNPTKSSHFEEKMNEFTNVFEEVEQIYSFFILKWPYLGHMLYWFANM